VRHVTGRHYGVRRVCGAVLAVVLAVTIGSTLTDAGDPERVIAAGALTAAPPAPLERVERMLAAQATALEGGDLAGWLAPVDRRIHPQYQNLFRTLRALRVTTVEYRVTAGRPPALTVEMAYCFERCNGKRPRIAQALTVRQAGDTYMISGLAKPDRPTSYQPTPWEGGDLVFAQGRRVTVAAPRELAGRLAEVVAVADRAAVIVDRYAALAGNRQSRYRIFLATDRQWRTWFGGKDTDWAAGYMQPLGDAGADVVLNPGRIRSRAGLREVIQHELGHVATIAGVSSTAQDMWLVEGVAEYIGAQPRRARATYNHTVLRRPSRLATGALPAGAGADEVAAFYAHGHFATECLVTSFGEARAMEFVRLRLRLGHSLDDAAYSVFGRPFAAVDKKCVGWLRDQAG
jgi:hypothetical protein